MSEAKWLPSGIMKVGNFMKLGLLSLAVVALIVPATVLLTACSSEVGGYQALPVARAVATQTPTSTVQVTHNSESRSIQMPRIRDYFTDGDYNYFLLDVGAIQHMYLATIFTPTFNPGGHVTINMAQTSTTTTAVTQGATNSASSSLTTSTTEGASVSLSYQIQAGPSFARVTAGVSVSANFSVTQTGTTTRSWSTNLSEAVSHGTQETFGVTIGPNAERGYYRAALFATSDIFIVLQTSLDNTELVEFQEVTIASGFSRRVEFSPTRTFDNSPVTPINLHDMSCEWFLRALPVPEEEGPPYHITNLNFRKVVAGAHTAAITESGELWAWGGNNFGQLGDGTTTTRHVPVRIGTAINWSYVSIGGGHTVAITSSGQLWAWGRNDWGQLGIGTSGANANRHIPTRVGTASNWASVSAGSYFTVAITTSGQLWTWGSNNGSQLGDGTSINRSSPMRIGSATNWDSVSAGNAHTLALTTNGQIWSWGSNSRGQLGISGGSLNIPTRIGTTSNWSSVSAGNTHSTALTTDGQLWAWGLNEHGQLGDSIGVGTLAGRSTPTRVGVSTNWISVSAGGFSTLAVDRAGRLWSWGNNNSGQLGNGTTIRSYHPVEIVIPHNPRIIAMGGSHAVVLMTNGQLWAWGNNNSGRLGDNTTTNRHAPVIIASPS